jgi:hypothetical protein
VAEHPEVFRHVGLLVNEPPGTGRIALYLVIRNFDSIAGQSTHMIREGFAFNSLLIQPYSATSRTQALSSLIPVLVECCRCSQLSHVACFVQWRAPFTVQKFYL